MGPIYYGNHEDSEDLTAKLVAKCDAQSFKHDEVEVPRIATQDVWDHFTKSKASAAGLDSWEPAELKLLSPKVCDRIAQLYEAIERGVPWPVGTKKAKAAYMTKPGGKVGDPMSQRVLTIMSALYRKRVTMRLEDMSEWTQTWANQNMYAGVGDTSADEAWYSAAAEMEEILVEGKHFVGGIADIEKFFDSIYISELLQEAVYYGVPLKRVSPYLSGPPLAPPAQVRCIVRSTHNPCRSINPRRMQAEHGPGPYPLAPVDLAATQGSSLCHDL